MTILCAWCKEYLGEKEPLADHRVTHSICLKCKTTITKDAGYASTAGKEKAN